MLTVSHHFLILQKSQGGHREKRALPEPDEFDVLKNRDKVKDFTSFTSEHTPFCYDFKRFDDRVQYYNLCFDTESGAPAVRECITIDTSLHVS